ncbi:phosphate ABC transporter permease PstA [Metallibacterium sp.]|uniref:phosphate ABC transporter permease PstA n=1 Tax=Metallibacterium sp. TaxID=2940281 RepID=UPI0026083DE6|nr:phosphate ABC transporter permease PstA [Metallibacterium sp.]
MSDNTWMYRRRRLGNALALVLGSLATLFGLSWLAWILWVTISKGMSALSPALFTQLTPPPPGDGGGLANAFFGSVMVSLIALLIGTPIGIGAGLWLAEYAQRRALGTVVRFLNDILLSAPSIVLGLFVYSLVVKPLGHFSALAGGLALALIVLPVVVRTTDEMLRLVPSTMREAALSLGVPQWKVIVQILLRSARAGVVTGILLALARITGETAPLLFTALNNQYWNHDLLKPIATVPVVIFQFAMSPYDGWHALAWAGALVVTAFVLVLSLLSRLLLARTKVTHD